MSTSDATKQSLSLLGRYRPLAGSYDEMMGPDLQLRPHWRKLMGFLQALTPAEIAARRESAATVLRDQDVTYNVYGGSRGYERPWPLDLMPLIMPPTEWVALQAGLIQRARLLNAILADIYGPQLLVREGLLPPALVYANPAFLRACHGIIPPRNAFLSLYAVDLGRSSDGQWWALSDRTQAPAGVGYSLQNRMVISHVFPDEFRDCRVERLNGFFDALNATLRGLAGKPSGRPTVVILTPGPFNENYFEHVYLARYLGLPLVQGTDLTARDRRIFLKTLEGLQQVDVILRRADDSFCDPLELRAESFLGVPGLVDATRAGNVVVANALGSGVVESPALSGFLPGICRRLLDEELKIPSARAWWCGQPAERQYALDHLDSLVLRRSFERGLAVFGGRLSEGEREELRLEIQRAPHEFVTQEILNLSSSPIFEGAQLIARRVLLRTYIAASGEGFVVMPGGLGRFAGEDDLVISMQQGGSSKDTWVLTAAPETQLNLALPSTQIVRLERSAAEVPSRVADNLYWLGRYAERLEDTVRLMRAVLVRLAEVGAEETPELATLVCLLSHLDLFPAKFRERHTLAAVEREVYALIYQRHRIGAVREVRERLGTLGFALRDRFSADTWRILHKLQLDARPRPGHIPISEVIELLNTLLFDIAAFAGMEMENMTRGHGWRFLDVGRRIERAANINTLVQAALTVDAGGETALGPVLEIADSVMTYRRRYFAQPQWVPSLDLLLADETNPRSLAFQINALVDHAANLPGSETLAVMRQVGGLKTALLQADLAALARTQFGGERPELSELLARVVNDLRAFSDLLNHHYFTHVAARPS